MGTKRYIFVDYRRTVLGRSGEQNASPLKVGPRPDVIPALAGLSASGYDLICLSADPLNEVEQMWLDILATQGCPFAAKFVCSEGEGTTYSEDQVKQIQEFSRNIDGTRSFFVGKGNTFLSLIELLALRALPVAGERPWPDLAQAILTSPRSHQVHRKTAETDITVAVNLDGSGKRDCRTGLGFFDHMLDQLAKHSGMDLSVRAEGDLHIDDHHTVEDTALAIGAAIKGALGNKWGIQRHGFLLPMDESLCQVALDLSGRTYFLFEGDLRGDESALGGFRAEMTEHFFRSLSEALQANLHISIQGKNLHHMIEACFKGVAKALKGAISEGGSQGIPSTKGSL